MSTPRNQVWVRAIIVALLAGVVLSSVVRVATDSEILAFLTLMVTILVVAPLRAGAVFRNER